MLSIKNILPVAAAEPQLKLVSEADAGLSECIHYWSNVFLCNCKHAASSSLQLLVSATLEQVLYIMSI